jgi:hypothetical protein
MIEEKKTRKKEIQKKRHEQNGHIFGNVVQAPFHFLFGVCAIVRMNEWMLFVAFAQPFRRDHSCCFGVLSSHPLYGHVSYPRRPLDARRMKT